MFNGPKSLVGNSSNVKAIDQDWKDNGQKEVFSSDNLPDDYEWEFEDPETCGNIYLN